MFGLSEIVKWVILFLGLLLVIPRILELQYLLDDYPIFKLIAFPYIWIVGCTLIFVAIGFDSDKEKRSNSGGVDGAPGMGERKKGLFGDGPFGGDGGSDGGGGGGGD